MKTLLKTFILICLLSNGYHAISQEIDEKIQLSGPRVGFTYLPPAASQWIHYYMSEVSESALEDGMLVTQFGWQFEERVMELSNGSAFLLETVAMVGGFDKGLVLPSISFLVGYRSQEGIEFGMGPNLTNGGPGIVYAFGITRKLENVYIPINLALNTSSGVTRVSLLMGFNFKNKKR